MHGHLAKIQPLFVPALVCLLIASSGCRLRSQAAEERVDSRHENTNSDTAPLSSRSAEQPSPEISQTVFDQSAREITQALENSSVNDPKNGKESPSQSSTSATTNTNKSDLLGALDTKRGRRRYQIRMSVAEYKSSTVSEILTGYGKGRFFGKVDGFCTCGAVNEVTVIWEFQGQKGTLETLEHGEFIIGRYPPHDWREHTAFEGLVGGEQSIFLGADSDGDGRCGIFECDHHHKWRNHDDIRAALSCNIAQCPADKINGTVLKVRYHPSHAAH